LITKNYADFRKQAEFAFFIVSIALSPVTIVGNLMVHISMYKFRNLRTVTNMFIGSLALADCIIFAFFLVMIIGYLSGCKIAMYLSTDMATKL
jgi:cobalamin biosynthesis protein CobD/CbiB